MRGFLVPTTGDPLILEASTWSDEMIRRSLDAEVSHIEQWPHRGPSGRAFAAFRPGPVSGPVSWGYSLARRRPCLVFAVHLEGHLTSLSRADVLFLALIFSLETTLLALPSPPKE